MQGRVSKKEQAMNRFSKNLENFSCPICGDPFSLDVGGIVCGNRHTFDLARKGYFNLFMGSQTDNYDEKLFSARRKIFEAGIFDPLIREIIKITRELNLEFPFILDAGCGEGSLLVRLSQFITEAIFLGIDISRDAIKLAAEHYEQVMWCVADLAKLPIKAGTVDLLLNVLSPANYAEFRRVLKPKGVVVKIFPGSDYLLELRQRLDGLETYSNEDILARFEENLTILSSTTLHYQVPLNPELQEAVIQMTPLSQHRKISDQLPNEITLHLQIVVGTLDVEAK